MSDGILCEFDEDGVLRKYEEPYTTMDIMTEKEFKKINASLELATKLLEIDLDVLDYITDITVSFSKCMRDDKYNDKIRDEIFNTLTAIENIKLGYEKGLR